MTIVRCTGNGNSYVLEAPGSEKDASQRTTCWILPFPVFVGLNIAVYFAEMGRLYDRVMSCT